MLVWYSGAVNVDGGNGDDDMDVGGSGVGSWGLVKMKMQTQDVRGLVCRSAFELWARTQPLRLEVTALP